MFLQIAFQRAVLENGRTQNPAPLSPWIWYCKCDQHLRDMCSFQCLLGLEPSNPSVRACK